MLRRSKLNPNAKPFYPHHASFDMPTQINVVDARCYHSSPITVNITIVDSVDKTDQHRKLEEMVRNFDHNTPQSQRPIGFERDQISHLNALTGVKWSWNPFDSFHIVKQY